MQQQPNVVGLKLCEQPIVQEGTRNVTLVNCFRKLSFAEFPAHSDPFYVCVVLTDGLGDYRLTLTIVSLADLGDVWSQTWNVNFSDQVAEHWILLPVNDCEFPEEGAYQVELNIDGEPAARTVLRIIAD